MARAWKRRLKRCLSAKKQDRGTKIRAWKLSFKLNDTVIQQGWRCDPCETAMRFKLDGDAIQVGWRRLKSDEKVTFRRQIDKDLIHSRFPTYPKNRLFASKDTPVPKEWNLSVGCRKNIFTFVAYRNDAERRTLCLSSEYFVKTCVRLNLFPYLCRYKQDLQWKQSL